VDSEEGQLGNILGLGGIAEHAASGAIDRMLVAPDERLEGGIVAIPDPEHELRIGRRIALS